MAPWHDTGQKGTRWCSLCVPLSMSQVLSNIAAMLSAVQSCRLPGEQGASTCVLLLNADECALRGHEEWLKGQSGRDQHS